MSRLLQPAASSSRISPASSSDGGSSSGPRRTPRSPARNRREARISSFTRLGVLYRGPRSRYSARSSASVARRATYAPKSSGSSPPVASAQRRRSAPIVAGSPTRTRARPGWRARIRCCCRSLGRYGSRPGSMSASRAARRPGMLLGQPGHPDRHQNSLLGTLQDLGGQRCSRAARRSQADQGLRGAAGRGDPLPDQPHLGRRARLDQQHRPGAQHHGQLATLAHDPAPYRPSSVAGQSASSSR